MPAPPRLLLPLLLAAGGFALAEPVAAPSGIRAGMDTAASPGDNFFRYANGGWFAATEIPADRSSWGVDAVLTEEAAGHTKELLEKALAEPRGADARKAGEYYASYMDEAAIEAKPTLGARFHQMRERSLDHADRVF